MGRFIPGEGAKLVLPLVASALTPNDDPGAAATPRIYDGTVGGAPVAGDTATVTLGSFGYGYMVLAGNTVGDVATGLTAACNLGSLDSVRITLADGPVNPGDTIRITIDGVNYDYVAVPADTLALCAAGVALLIQGVDPNYGASAVGDDVILQAVARGPGFTITTSWTVGTETATKTQIITGVSGQALWTASNIAAAFTLTHSVPGATTDTASWASTGGLSTPAFTMTQPGDDASVPSESGLTLAGSIATSISAECRLLAGVSYDVEFWYRDSANVWTQDVLGPTTVAGNVTLALTKPATAMRCYAYVYNFVGGGEATVTVATPS